MRRPQIDTFASRLTYKVCTHVSWKPDPLACAVDAFTLNLAKYDLIYCFPPFCLIGRVLQKIKTSQTTALMMVAQWKSQYWYALLLKILIEPPILIPIQKTDSDVGPRSIERAPTLPQVVSAWVSGKYFKSRASVDMH